MENLPLSRIRIAAPCKAEWKWMYGDDRVRFCSQCSQNVYNLSAMTREEAELLISRTEERVCVRFYRRKDGTILTRNCPVGLQAIKDKLTSTKATLIAAILSFWAYVGVLIGFYSSRTDVGVIPVMAEKLGIRNFVTTTGEIAWTDPDNGVPVVSRSEPFMADRALLKLIPISHQRGAAAIRGFAVVRILVTETGRVDSATLDRGPEELAGLAEEAASGWTFKPLLVDGKPVRVETTLSFQFK